MINGCVFNAFSATFNRLFLFVITGRSTFFSGILPMHSTQHVKPTLASQIEVLCIGPLDHGSFSKIARIYVKILESMELWFHLSPSFACFIVWNSIVQRYTLGV